MNLLKGLKCLLTLCSTATSGGKRSGAGQNNSTIENRTYYCLHEATNEELDYESDSSSLSWGTVSSTASTPPVFPGNIVDDSGVDYTSWNPKENVDDSDKSGREENVGLDEDELK